MKSLLYFLITLLLLLLLFNCNNGDANNRLQEKSLDTDKVHSLTAQKTNVNGKQVGRVMMMYFVGDNLILGDLPTNYLFKVYDSTQTSFFEVCKVGEGPNEFKFPTFLQSYVEDDTLKIRSYNPNRGRCDEFDWNKTLSQKKVLINNTSSIKFESPVQKLANAHALLSVGLFPKRYRVSDNKSLIIKEFGEYPFKNDFPKVSSENLAMAFQGEFTVNSEGTKVAFATLSSTNIDFLDIQESTVSIVKQYNVTKPSFQASSQPGEFSAAITTDNKMGFLDIQSDDKYVYALYSGKDLQKGVLKAFESDVMYVFDWSGNLISKFKLNMMISKFTIKKSQNQMFAFVDSAHPQIVLFNLPKNL
jgi:hypothetical protein